MIWIDASRINQADTVERSSQVAMMYKIYSAARYVVVDSIPKILGTLADAHRQETEPSMTLDADVN